MIEEVLELTRGLQRQLIRPIADTARREGAVNVRTEDQEGHRKQNIIHNIWEIFNGAGIEHDVRFVSGSTVEVRMSGPLPLPDEVRTNLDAFSERRGLTIDVIATENPAR